MGILPTLIKRLSETQYLRPILLLLNALCMESSCVGQIGEIENSLRALKVLLTIRDLYLQFSDVLSTIKWQ